MASIAELVHAPFFNWYNAKCADLWSSPIYFELKRDQLAQLKNKYFPDLPHALFVYGAKNNLVVCHVGDNHIRCVEQKVIFENYDKFIDKGNITTVAFARNVQWPVVFAGSKDGQVVVINLDTNKFYKPPDTITTSSKITSAEWLDAANVFFATDKRVIHWNVRYSTARVLFNSERHVITCLAITRCDPYYLVMGTSNGGVIYSKISADAAENEQLIQARESFDLSSTEVCSIATAWTHINGNAIAAAVARNGSACIVNMSNKKIIDKFDQDVLVKGKRAMDTTKNYFAISFVPCVEENCAELWISGFKGNLNHYYSIRGSDSDVSHGDRIDASLSIDSKSPRLSHSAVVFNICTVGRFSGGRPDKRGWFASKYAHYELPLIAVSISKDKQAILWDVTTKQAKCALKTLSHQIRSMASNDTQTGKLAACGGDDLRIFDFTPLLNPISSLTRDVYASTTHTLFGKKTILSALDWHENMLAIGTYTGDVVVYDTTKKLNSAGILFSREEKKKNPRDCKIYSLKFGPVLFEKRVEKAVYIITSDKKLTAYLISGKGSFDFTAISDHRASKVGKSDVAFRGDWKYAAIGFTSGQVEVYLTNDGKLDQTKTFELLLVLDGHCRLINCLSWSPLTVNDVESKFQSYLAVASDEDTITIHSLGDELSNHSGKINCVGPTSTLSGHSKRVTSLNWSRRSDGQLVSCSCEEKLIYVWDIGKSEMVAAYKNHVENVLCADFAEFEEDLVISASTDGTVQLWRPSQNTLAMMTAREEQLRPATVAIQNVNSQTQHILDIETNDTTETLTSLQIEVRDLKAEIELFKQNWKGLFVCPLVEEAKVKAVQQLAEQKLKELKLQEEKKAQQPHGNGDAANKS